MNNTIYVSGTGAFLPNAPVSNDRISDYLGIVDQKLESVKRMVLKRNGITQRYYALDENGNRTHTNAEMCAKAMLNAVNSASMDISDVELMAAGTTMPDMLVPAYAQQVHGYLGKRGMESIPVIPLAGVCLASFHSMFTAHAFLKIGQYHNALVGSGERSSVLMQANHFSEEFSRQRQLAQIHDGYSYFEAEFLRYMLSDGAAAAFLTTKRPDGYCLKVDWMRTKSYANKADTCMYMGDLEPDSYNPNSGWLARHSLSDSVKDGLLNLRQKTTILKSNIVPFGIAFMKELIEEGLLDLSSIKWIAAHISSHFFLEEIENAFIENGISYPMNRFFTNLKDYGNIGSGAFFLLLHHLVENRLLDEGESALFFVPESARFAYGYMQVTAV